jgi:hypothetical protein
MCDRGGLGYIEPEWATTSPEGKRLNHRRRIYTNRFPQIGRPAEAKVIKLDILRRTA